VGSYVFRYSIATDTFHFSYMPEDDFPGMQSESEFSNGELVPEGQWTAFVSPYAIDALNSGIGITLKLESGELLELIAHPQPPADRTDTVFVPFPGRQITLRVEHDEGILRYSWSEDLNQWYEVARFSPSSPVSEVGVVLRYDREEYPAGGHAGQARLFAGTWEHVVEEVWLGEPEEAPHVEHRGAPPEVTVHSTTEPLVHVIVGAQFGDLEFDVGKSVRWVTWFCDNVFVLDVNLGTPRYWIVNWAETFPDAKHTVTGINYFVLPAQFRAEQWKQYQLAFGEPHDDDWILWLDASEGLNVDNRTLPDDYSFEPFKSFLWREIQRAVDLGQPSAVLPYYVFLRSDHIVNVTYETAVPEAGADLQPLQAISTPYYQAHQGLKRLWKASELKKANFDWTQLDTVTTPSAGAKTALVSYAYAHWHLQDIEPPAIEVPPLTADNDDGYRMRQLMSRVRPVPGIPVSDTWIPPSSDPAGLPGPWSPADVNNPDPIQDSGPYLNATKSPARSVWAPDAPDLTVTTDIVTTAKVRSSMDLTGANYFTVASTIGSGAPDFGWRFWFAYGNLQFGYSVDGTTVTDRTLMNAAQISAAFRTDVPFHIGVTFRLNNGGMQQVQAITSADGVTWTPIGTPVSVATPLTGFKDTPARLQIGAQHQNVQHAWNGSIYWVEQRKGIVPGQGELVWRFDASEYPGTGTTWPDPRGRQWTAVGTDTMVVNQSEPVQQPVAPHASMLGLVTPLYDNAFRINMRDGVWYEEGLSGNIPLKWDEERQDWTTDYDPAEWADHGVKAYDPTAVP
jgi:hypothetical protein